MAVNIQELNYRPGIEQLGNIPRPEHFGAVAFDAALFNTMLLAHKEPESAFNTELAARTLALARAYAGQRDPRTFIEDHRKLRTVGASMVRTVLSDDDMVLEIIDNEAHQGVTADFVLELASLGDETNAILDTVTEITAEAPDEAIHNFRELLLEQINEEETQADSIRQDKSEIATEPVSLTAIVSTVLDELTSLNFSGQIPAQRVIDAFPEIRRDLTRLNRNRGADGKMIVDVDDIADLLVSKRGRDLNTAPKARKQEIKTVMRRREEEAKKQKGGDIYGRSSIR
ncbi:hypothetical protein BH09PAT1_BH09PAT1_1040 [soil metagenome]